MQSPPLLARFTHSLAIGALALLTPLRALGDYEAVAFGVTDYGPCSSSDLDYTVLDAIAANAFWYDLDYDAVYYYTNGNVEGRDFAQHTTFSWGRDNVSPTGTDWADVIYFSGHGGRNCTASPKFSWLLMGADLASPSSSEDCSPRLTKSNSSWLAGHIRLGNGGSDEDANIAILDASHSLTWCIVETFELMNIDWGGTGAQFVEINGYYGSPRDTVHNHLDTHDYINSAAQDYIGDNWIDYMTDIRVGNDNDDCPAVLIFSEHFNAANAHYISVGFKQFFSTGTQHDEQWYWVPCNCDPSGENSTNNLPGC